LSEVAICSGVVEFADGTVLVVSGGFLWVQAMKRFSVA
jgi:hypothetical protein